MAEGSSRRHCVSYKQPNNKTVSYPNNQSIQNHLGFKNGVDLILGGPKDIEKSSMVSWKLYKNPQALCCLRLKYEACQLKSVKHAGGTALVAQAKIKWSQNICKLAYDLNKNSPQKTNLRYENVCFHSALAPKYLLSKMQKNPWVAGWIRTYHDSARTNLIHTT